MPAIMMFFLPSGCMKLCFFYDYCVQVGRIRFIGAANLVLRSYACHAGASLSPSNGENKE